MVCINRYIFDCAMRRTRRRPHLQNSSRRFYKRCGDFIRCPTVVPGVRSTGSVLIMCYLVDKRERTSLQTGPNESPCIWRLCHNGTQPQYKRGCLDLKNRKTAYTAPYQVTTRAITSSLASFKTALTKCDYD